MLPPIVCTKGQDVRLDFNGQVVKATVDLASSNGRSLLLMFDGALLSPSGGMFVGTIPLLWQDGAFADLAEGTPAVLALWSDN
jgi:hypothetical protein